MTTATDNSPTGGTDSAQPSTDLDNPANWDYFDPDDEQDNEAPKEATGTAVEKAEKAPQAAEEQPEESVQEASADEQQGTTEEAPEEETPAKEPQAELVLTNDTRVKLPNGESRTVKELLEERMLKADYSRKRQIDAQRATHIQAISENIQNYLKSQIPPPPDPRLAYENPTAYAAQLAQHDASVRHWQSVTQIAEEAKQTAESFSAEERAAQLEAQQELLHQRLPALKTPEGVEKFRAKIEPAAKHLGMTADEINGIVDHRFLVGLELAAEGLAARKAREIAKQKVQNVPPVAPAKRQAAPNANANKSAEAMRRLARSGSILDAVNVDFD